MKQYQDIVSKINRQVFIIAEISANHNQNIDYAKELIVAAKESGANAVKFQFYNADSLTVNANNEYFQIKNGGLWDGQTLYELYKNSGTPLEWAHELYNFAHEHDIIPFSSVYDAKEIPLLEDVDNPIYKIASFENEHTELIRSVARLKKPVIISSGLLDEISWRTFKYGLSILFNYQVPYYVLKCVSSYPTNPSEINLFDIKKMQNELDCPIGFSDHTTSTMIAAHAVIAGATLIEKHLRLPRIRTVDSDFSLTPNQFHRMVKNIREAELLVNGNNKQKKDNTIFKRSIFAIADINEGDIFTEQNIKVIRPGYGLPPVLYRTILGARATRKIKANHPIKKDDYIK